jgi:hypothetical protein
MAETPPPITIKKSRLKKISLDSVATAEAIKLVYVIPIVHP